MVKKGQLFSILNRVAWRIMNGGASEGGGVSECSSMTSILLDIGEHENATISAKKQYYLMHLKIFVKIDLVRL